MIVASADAVGDGFALAFRRRTHCYGPDAMNQRAAFACVLVGVLGAVTAAWPVLVGAVPVAGASAVVVPGEWPDWRGPNRDGISPATGLPESWSPDGDNLAWKAPYGGRSAPVVFGNRLYLQNAAGHGAETQERILALDADSGELVWEYRFNVTLSDAPPHRVGWSSPVVDPATGNVYALGMSGTLLGLSPAGELLWERYLSEDFGLLSTHGGRTVSPIIEAGNVIVAGVTAGWGSLARGMHRFLAFDKLSGAVAWVSSTGTRVFDTTYSPPIVLEINGTRLVIGGAGDGAVHAYKAATGELVWRFAMSKRGINTGVVVSGTTAFVSHSEENLTDSTMGLVAAIDVAGSGELGPDQVLWTTPGLLSGYSSPLVDGNRFYQIDNGANLIALDVTTGRQLWSQSLGTIQRASPVLADGKLYVGTQNGVFYILRPGAEGVEILDAEQMMHDGDPDEIIASVAVARGRVYLVTHSALYAIGTGNGNAPATEETAHTGEHALSDEPVAGVMVYPQELVLAPNEGVDFEVRLFDAHGQRVGTVREAEWSLEGVEGQIGKSGRYVAAGTEASTGSVKVRIDGHQASTRLRVVPRLPWRYDFEAMESVPSWWIAAGGKFQLRDLEGNGVLVKTNDNPFLKRTKVFMGPTTLHDYTVQIDFKSAVQRRRFGDAGVIAQRYALIVFGTKQRIELQSWQPETERTITMPLSVRPDVWYTIKLRTQNLDGAVLVQGKVWPRGDPEPAAWTIERTDRLGSGNRHGSPGFYADAHAIVTFDNLTVESNQ